MSTSAVAASRTVNRMLYLAIGITGAVFGALSYESMRLQIYPPLPWLSTAFWALLVGMLVILGVLALWASHRVLRVVALVAGAVQLGDLILWLVLADGQLPADANVPWAITFTAVPAVAVAAAASSRLAWAYAIAVSALGGLLRGLTTNYEHPVLIGLQDGLYSLLLVSVFVGLVLAIKQSAEQLDDSVGAARREEVDHARRLARRRERLLINALVHDSVLSTLLMAGLGRTSAEAVARHAQKTTALLDSLAERESSGPVTIGELAMRLRQTAVKLQPHIVVEMRATDAAPPIPADAAAAIVDAVAEALRNSVLHAGTTPARPIEPRVRLDGNQHGIQVLVSDDGVGFDPARVPAARLGISHSILGRMQRVNGGSARLSSAPGRGTRVSLSWSPSEERAEAPATSAEYSLGGMQRLSRRAISAALLLFAVVHALLAFGDRDPRGPIVGEIVSVLAVVGAAVLVSRPAVYPLPHSTTVRVLVLCAVTATLQLFQITPGGSLPFVQWHLGAITLVLLVLVAQGRVGWAWTGYAVLFAATIGWAVANGLALGDGVDLVIRQAGTLLAGSLFVLGLRRSSATLETLNRQRTARTIEDATSVASLQERAAELSRVNSGARDLLDRLAGLRGSERLQARHDDCDPVDVSLRAECLLVEASLRDSIRGRSLSVEPVITAAHLARVRGIDVSLIDDGDDGALHCEDSVRQREVGRTAVGNAVAHELDRMQHGRLTARILPSGRPDIATIVVESGEQRMLIIAANGVVREL
ncbi:hypothetical protein GCM10022381_18290 [Leifsonia kafniensis]|uniref:Histidine kinase/HSP90-like ATPase domain-containing protein n=1 Tax=Leifsonia kafniensis TaxID=475957 RepID=A0ABP7KFM7_9MICO